MVRLKVLNLYERTMINALISIPYGAIKRCRHFWKQVFVLISIPYGAIKRLCNYVISVLLYTISIPYGAIKSQRRKCLLICYIHFNSLWCD